VLASNTPGGALELARDHQQEIHLLLTDVIMPEMNGRELLNNIQAVYPKLRHLFMSGYTANIIAHHGVLDERVNFVAKPFSKKKLGDKVREALDKEMV
jgi:YesN/AraC family two-component response regulator